MKLHTRTDASANVNGTSAAAMLVLKACEHIEASKGSAVIRAVSGRSSEQEKRLNSSFASCWSEIRGKAWLVSPVMGKLCWLHLLEGLKALCTMLSVNSGHVI